MRFFRDVYLSFEKSNTVISKEEFIAIFDRIKMDQTTFNKGVYVPGSSGQGQLYRDLLEKSGIGVQS